MEQVRLHVRSAGKDNASAEVAFTIDGMFVGIERVGAVALALLTGDWRDPTALVGMTFDRDMPID